MLTLVLHLLHRDDTMFGAWTIDHMTRVDQLQSKVEQLYRRVNSTVRTLTSVLRLLHHDVTMFGAWTIVHT
ncbi:hypothetical protein HO173_009828 [Letharia columbiana]|uniref:Uncharacterized protein n=1 Tax=Letharia columbiana TaxID=112416 RepID=A0A8H6L1E9_9LECA|nr:uncharacterized protein HO173_009828 [Letharia columbiana]KAF6231991.1 hypothetical protein HO173_009828 [Letharia columbiana]